MQIFIPYLFPSGRLNETACHNVRVPALETLLGRGRLVSCPAEGMEAALCQAFGILRQQDWPLAPITLEAEGQHAENAYWLRADPVHLSVMRDRIVLADSCALNLSQNEAEALTASIGQHFGDSLQPLPLSPQRWYVKRLQPPHLTTTVLSMATGCDIDPIQPQGKDAQQFRTLLNELQMLLFTHPVNQARESRGALPVNSLWLWGGGIKPVSPHAAGTLYASHHTAHALATYCSVRVRPPPSSWAEPPHENPDWIVLDELASAGQCGDAYGWREALNSLEANWFAPLLRTLGQLGPTGLQLVDPIHGKALKVSRADIWRIWRRPKKLASITR